MQHISESMTRVINSSKVKFFHGNRDKLIRYFESNQRYDAMINAGRFKDMEQIIKSKSEFNSDEFMQELINKKEENER